jgi:hypothetical protein
MDICSGAAVACGATAGGTCETGCFSLPGRRTRDWLEKGRAKDIGNLSEELMVVPDQRKNNSKSDGHCRKTQDAEASPRRARSKAGGQSEGWEFRVESSELSVLSYQLSVISYQLSAER